MTNMIVFRTSQYAAEFLPNAEGYRWLKSVSYCLTVENYFKNKCFFFLFFLGWVGTESTITEATTVLFYQPRIMDDGECSAFGALIGRGNRNTRRKPAPVPLYPP
jgi:hypothetical protein